MYEVTKYVADDGKEFEDEEECLEYEQLQKLASIDRQFLMLDARFNKVENPVRDFDEVVYIYVWTDEAAKKLHEVLGREWPDPWDYYHTTAGVWFMCEERDRWILVDEERERIRSIQDHDPNWSQSPNYI